MVPSIFNSHSSVGVTLCGPSCDEPPHKSAASSRGNHLVLYRCVVHIVPGARFTSFCNMEHIEQLLQIENLLFETKSDRCAIVFMSLKLTILRSTFFIREKSARYG